MEEEDEGGFHAGFNILPLAHFNPVEINHEPIIRNRFVVEFDTNLDIQSYLVQSVTMPKLERGNWENITIQFMDIIGRDSATQKLFDFSKVVQKQAEFSFDFSIKNLDPTGIETARWDIIVKEVICIDFGHLDYGNNDFLSLYLTVKPLGCIYINNL